ncbi:MAG: hypothetical protein ACON4R_15710 [Akkermansiaceae bacterium]
MNSIPRRSFLGKSKLLASSAIAFPNLLLARRTGGPLIMGEGEHQYEVIHDWPLLPRQFTWQTTHNVALDAEQNLYIMHEGKRDQKDHPSIFVFDPMGRFIRAFGSQFQGGGHGIEIRTEGKEQFLYVTAYLGLNSFAKLSLTGDIIWYQRAPMASGCYGEGEDVQLANNWGRKNFMPTDFAFHPTDGSFYLADGYGAHCIHHFDSTGNYLSTIGSPGKDDGQFNLPHGIWIDTRGKDEPTLVVTDRSNSRMQWFTLDGKHLKTMREPFTLPANIDVLGDLMLIPDLASRLCLLDKNNNPTLLGHDPEWDNYLKASKGKLRQQPQRWIDGKFVHPHDACFDPEGNIFVAEWVSTGRVTKLRKV